MKKWKGGAFVNDIDILWDIWLDDPEETTSDESVEDIDVLGNQTPDVVEPEVKAEEPVAPVEDATLATEDKPEPEAPKDEVKEGEDLDKWLDDLLKSNAETDDKVDEIKEVADESWNDSLIKLVDELQSLMAEKNLTIEELQKKVDVANNRYLSKFGWEEELSIYKPEIEKLQNNPRLMALVKFLDSDNEKVKPKLVSILSDMIFNLTWQDVSDLLDQKDKAALNVLNSWGSDSPIMQENKPEEEQDMSFEQSTNDILWF